MKKVLYLAMAFCFAFVMQSCDEVTDASEQFGLNENLTVNVNVDVAALKTTNFKVQTLLESVDYAGGPVAIKVFSNGKPQIIAITDSADNLRMLYRGPVSEGATITVDGNSTAIALVTFNPLFGPVPATDYNQLISVIQSASQYPNYRTAVDSSIARKKDLTSTSNPYLIAQLYNVIRELCETAFDGLEAIDSSSIAANSFFNCWPLVAATEGNTLVLRTSANCPSYYGTVTDGNGNVIKRNLYVGASQRYGFMDNFSGTADQSGLGLPANITFNNEGSYTVSLVCTDQSAQLDLYTRLANNVLAALGADVDPGMITLLSPVVKGVLAREGIDLTQAEIDSENLMDLIGELYNGVIEFLKENGSVTGIGEANWQLASNLLVRLINVYAEIRTTTDALLRTSWNIGQESGADSITLNIGYNNGVIRALDNYDITIIYGNNQSAPSYGLLDDPLGIRVREFGENGPQNAVGKTVQFVVVSGGGTVRHTTVTTDHLGCASTYWTLGGGNSGDIQTAYAVVVENGEEVTPRVYFNALVSNDRYRVSLCCEQYDQYNYASQWDIDFAVAEGTSGVVPLFDASGRQWDYDGTAEHFEMTGTINTNTNYVDMTVAMYVLPPNYDWYGNRIDTNIHFRTDRFQFTLGVDNPVYGTLIWDGGLNGQIYEAGCGCKIYLDRIVAGHNTPAAKAAAPKRAAKGEKGLAVKKTRR